MKTKSRRQQHLERLRELGREDLKHRCAFCKRELPKTGCWMRQGEDRVWCSSDCLDSSVERDAIMGTR